MFRLLGILLTGYQRMIGRLDDLAYGEADHDPYDSTAMLLDMAEQSSERNH